MGGIPFLHALSLSANAARQTIASGSVYGYRLQQGFTPNCPTNILPTKIA